MSERHPLVGSWRVAVSIPGVSAEIVNLASFSSDGLVLVVLPISNPAPPGAAHHVEYWTPAVGTWMATGPTSATMSFVTLGTDETGVSIGSHVVSATVETDADGTSWQGPFAIKIIAADGTTAGTVSGSVAASRIAANQQPA
jgi:hypothetical protein